MFKFCPVCGGKDIMAKPDGIAPVGKVEQTVQMTCFNPDCASKTFDDSKEFIISLVEKENAGST